MGLSFSLSKITAKIAAKIGAIYRRETAVPTERYLNEKKKRLIEIKPATALSESNFL